MNDVEGFQCSYDQTNAEKVTAASGEGEILAKLPKQVRNFPILIERSHDMMAHREQLKDIHVCWGKVGSLNEVESIHEI